MSAMGLDAALINQARRLLNRARVIAEASASQSSASARTHPQSRMPPGAVISQAGNVGRSEISTLEACGDRINRARSDAELSAAIDWCERELKSLQHGPKEVAETPQQFRARLCRDYEGVQARQVADAERTSITTVRDARHRAGRDARFGRRLQRSP